MKTHKPLTAFITFSLLFSVISVAQSSFYYKGYVSNLQSVWLPEFNNNMNISGTAQNRFDFFYYPSGAFTLTLGLRNIIEYGYNVQSIPGYSDALTKDNGFIDLTKIWSNKNGYVLYSTIDRLNLFFTDNYLEIQLGRQRINWGVNLIWTPNDIFNSTSYLNFDYAEKRGSDALRAQYYFDSSSLEIVYKVDNLKNITSSVMYRINRWDYDFQIFAGIMEDDYVLGGGWSGNITDANFSGEITYFKNRTNFADTTGQFVLSLGGTYTFLTDFYIHAEFLFNSAGTTGKANGSIFFLQNDYNAKNLSPAKYSFFGEVACQITPLVKLDLNSVFNPSDFSYYIGPFASFSVSQSMDMLLGGQFFFGERFTEWGDYGEFYFLRLQWNF